MAPGMSRGLNCANCTCETRGAVPLTRPSATLACAAPPRCKAPPNSAKAKTDLRTIDRGPPIRAPGRGRTGEAVGSPPDITWTRRVVDRIPQRSARFHRRMRIRFAKTMSRAISSARP